MREYVTLMFFRSGGGKVRSLNIPRKVFNGLLVFLLIVLFLAGFSTYTMVTLYGENRTLDKQIVALTKDHQTVAENESSRPQEDSPGDAGQVAENRGGEEASRQEGEEPIEETVKQVSLENIHITEIGRGQGFELNFDVVKNEQSEVEKINGMVVVVGKIGNSYFTAPPNLALREGIPVDPRKGESFVILYRKTFDQSFAYFLDSVETLTVFVYDEAGGLLLRENVELR